MASAQGATATSSSMIWSGSRRPAAHRRVLGLRPHRRLDRRRVGHPRLGVDRGRLRAGRELGRRLQSPLACSKAWPARSTRASSNGRPAICSDSGRPSLVKPHSSGERRPAGAVEGRGQVRPLPERERIVPVEARGGRGVGGQEQVVSAVERPHLRQDGAPLAAGAHIVLGREQAGGEAARPEVLAELPRAARSARAGAARTARSRPRRS